MRYIQLVPEQARMLERIRRHSRKARVRDRALGLLLSHQGRSVNQLAAFFDVHRNTVINWFNAFESYGLVGLYDAKGRGRTPKLNPEQAKQVKAWVQESPQDLDRVVGQVAEHFELSVSRWTVKRAIQDQGMTWRRVRRGMPKQEAAEVLEKKTKSLPC